MSFRSLPEKKLAEGDDVLNSERQAKSIPMGLRPLAQGFRTLGNRRPLGSQPHRGCVAIYRGALFLLGITHDATPTGLADRLSSSFPGFGNPDLKLNPVVGQFFGPWQRTGSLKRERGVGVQRDVWRKRPAGKHPVGKICDAPQPLACASGFHGSTVPALEETVSSWNDPASAGGPTGQEAAIPLGLTSFKVLRRDPGDC